MYETIFHLYFNNALYCNNIIFQIYFFIFHRPTRSSERNRDSPPCFLSQKFTGVKEYSKCL